MRKRKKLYNKLVYEVDKLEKKLEKMSTEISYTTSKILARYVPPAALAISTILGLYYHSTNEILYRNAWFVLAGISATLWGAAKYYYKEKK
jgi:hypothetical protein